MPSDLQREAEASHDWVLAEGLWRRAEALEGWTEQPGNKGFLLGEDLAGDPWCALFVMLLFEQCGRPIHGTKTVHQRKALRSVQYMEVTFRKHHSYRSVLSGYTPCRGDVVFQPGRSASDPGKGRHVSILGSVDVEKRKLVVASGNWGNKIAIHDLDWSPASVTGFGWIPVDLK